MLNLEKKIFDALEKCQLNDFKNTLTKNVNLPDSDICSMFNICMLEINTKKDFAIYMFNTFGDILSKKENKCLLDSFSNYWSRDAKSFYNELKNNAVSKTRPKHNTTSGSSYDVEFLREIKQVRNKVSQLFGAHFNALNESKRKIIFDVFTFLVFKCKTSEDVLNFSNNAFINKLNERSISQFSVDVCNMPINFRSILDFSIKTLDLKDYVPYDYLDKLLSNEKLLSNKSANLAMNIYLLREKFNWVPLSNSSFGYNLENAKEFDFTHSDPVINCWEAVLYAMYKSNIVDLNTLKNLYLSSEEVDTNVAHFFDYKNATPINVSNWKETLSETTNVLLGDAFDVQKGINHVMLSVPYSQKQLLKMLITEQFDEKPCNMKFYSHWNKYTNNTLNSIPKNTFNKVISDNLVFRARDINTF